MPPTPYQNREIDEKFDTISKTLTRIEYQTTRTNGRVSKLERYLLIVGCVTATLLATNSSEVISIIKLII